MGLDWHPVGKPKAGHEEEFEKLYQDVILQKSADPVLVERWRDVRISPFETIGAPRVGFDRAADDWIAKRYPGRSLRTPFLTREKFVKRYHGYRILELLPPNDGLPIYSNGSFGGRIDISTFRAKFLEFCFDVIDDDVLAEAWSHHRPEELTDYGVRLRDRALAFARKNNLLDVIGRRDPPDEEDLEHPAMQAHIVSAASRWCLFWSERGHGMVADF